MDAAPGAARAAHQPFGRAEAVGHGGLPRRRHRRPDLRQEGLARRADDPRRDAEAAGRGLARELMDHGGVPAQKVGLQLVQAGHDPIERPGRGQALRNAAGERERLTQRRGHVRGLVGGDHRHHGELRPRSEDLLRHTTAETQVAQEDDGPRVAVVDERAAPPARSAGRARVVLVEQVGVRREPGEVRLDDVAREPRVGHDLVEVLHEIVLGHDRERAQVRLAEPVRVDGGEPATVPRRARLRVGDEGAETRLALGTEPLDGPGQPLEGLRHQLEQARDVRLPERLVVGHGRTLAEGALGRQTGPRRHAMRGARPGSAPATP